jgi:hypothetical protein
MIDRFAIYLLLAGCLIFGGIVFVELQPATENESTLSARATQPQAPTSAVHRQPSTDELLAKILERPLFSSTRRPPQAAANDSATDSDLADTRLTGIVTEPDHHYAIFAVNGAPKPLRLTEGEDLSGWRIESITPHEVSLSGPGGTKTLEPKFDPNLVQRPPPQPPAATPGAPQPFPGINLPPRRAPQPAQPPAATPAARQPAPGINLPPRPGLPSRPGFSPATGRPLRPLPPPPRAPQ